MSGGEEKEAGGPAARLPATEVLGVTEHGLAVPVERVYLMVFEQSSARAVRLPRTGEARIGRAPELEVRLDDAAVSRHHATITLRRGRASIRDLGSQNGTHVDGVRAEGEVEVRSGATITVCNTQIVFHGPPGGRRDRSLDLDELRTLLADEVERAALLERSVGVIAVRAGRAEQFLLDAVRDELRGVDQVAMTGADELVAILPELDPDDAPRAARRFVDAVARAAGGARATYAVYPADGADAASLIAVVRTSLATAPPGVATAARPEFRTFDIGGKRMLVADEAMARLVELLERLAAVDLPVLVLGETGTGKELAAAAVHHFSRRSRGPLVSFNCAAIQESLAESELFGHEKGAFSGAAGHKAGLFETSTGGTLFLDEVGELSPTIQAKLLRVLEARRFTRVGSVVEREIDVRIVAATNRDLPAEVEAGRFRSDLYFRLSAAAVWLPPLRDRPREISLLAQAFLEGGRRAARLPPAALTLEAHRLLAAYPWPGNIRQLKNCMEFIAAASPTATIDAAQVEAYLQRNPGRGGPAATEPPASTRPAPSPLGSFRPIKAELRELERRRMVEALGAARGNQRMAAALIEMPLRTFVLKLKQYEIDSKAPA